MGTLLVLMLWISCNIGIEVLGKRMNRRKRKTRRRRTVYYKEQKSGISAGGYDMEDDMDYPMSA